MGLSNATNAMRRAIEDLYYRPLNDKEKDRIWAYFESRCAYCDRLIKRGSRDGHMDHLECNVSCRNYIRNRVLACKECNGNEKRELNWQVFLKSKCTDRAPYQHRKAKIRNWQKLFPELPTIVLSREAETANAAVIAAISNFERHFVRFRKLLRSGGS